MKCFKLATSVLAAILLMSSLFFIPAFASGIEPSGNTGKIPLLKTAEKLDKRDVLNIVESQIQGYLKTDLQTAGRHISASTDFIELYDLDNNVFAYMVPLLEHGREIGYITVGAITDGYATYEIFINDNAVRAVREKLNQKSATNGNKAQLVFMPPMTYLIKTSNGQSEQYFKLEHFTDEKEITVHVVANKQRLQSRLDSLRSDDNRARISRLLESVRGSSTAIAPNASLAAVTPENVALSTERNYGQFVPVEYQPGKYSYGGDQNWWSDKTKKNRGCGPVAAANITNYLAKITNPSKYGDLYIGNTTSKTDFLAHMDVLYSYIKPGLLGEVSVWDFAENVEQFAQDRGVNLSRVTSNASFTLDNTADYIKAGLQIDSPVATLNTTFFSDYEYEWHWMTITKYYRDSADNRWIAVSTWGERRSIDYRVHFDAMTNSLIQGGLMYFK